MEKQPDIEKLVADYLREHPEFFVHRVELLRDIVIPHDAGGAVSLIERQVSVLRSQNHELRAKIRDMIEIARANEHLSGRILTLAETFLDAPDLETVFGTVYAQAREEFDADAVSIRLFMDAVPGTDTHRQEFAGKAAAERKLFTALTGNHQPICGRLKQQQLEWLFPEAAGEVKSAVMLPLYGPDWDGVLAIGSSDQKRFHAGMATDLLSHLSAMLSLTIHARVCL